MEDRLWGLLEESGFEAVRELRLHFLTPWHVACSVDGIDDSVTMVEQVLPNALPSEHKKMGALLWKWLTEHTSLFKRVQDRLLAKATRIEAPTSNALSPGEVFDQCVSGNLELCKQTSRAHARWISNGAGTPADAERAAKKFWGTVLVQGFQLLTSRLRARSSGFRMHFVLWDPAGRRPLGIELDPGARLATGCFL